MGPPPPPPGDDLGEWWWYIPRLLFGDMCNELCLPCLFVLEWWCMCGESWMDEPDEVDEADGDTEAGEMVGVIVVLK